ncbi:MAG: hypothetical protein PHQ52_05785 [Candidatus Omnitrophica bacterium]|nr:hypothetical protein [Candidatus Omnitrophota bacterium]
MGRYDKLLMLFIGLLVFFIFLMVFRIGCSKDKEILPEKKITDTHVGESLNEKIQRLEERQRDLEQKLLDNKKDISEDQQRDDNVNIQQVTPLEGHLADYLVTETVTKENIAQKAVWQATKTQGIYLVSVNLENEPIENSLLIWTGMGILPLKSYKLNGKVLSIIMQQPQQQFIAESDFINIRYFRK